MNLSITDLLPLGIRQLTWDQTADEYPRIGLTAAVPDLRRVTEHTDMDVTVYCALEVRD